jgi:hypothetical protein
MGSKEVSAGRASLSGDTLPMGCLARRTCTSGQANWQANWDFRQAVADYLQENGRRWLRTE